MITARDLVRRTLEIGPALDGTPGLRDPDNPCHMFEPGEPGGIADCYGDGHYLCRECPHQDPAWLDPPMAADDE